MFDYTVVNKVKTCLFNDEKIEKTIGILEENLHSIDFDDEDDMRNLTELIRSSLNFNGDKSLDGIKLVEFLVSKGYDLNFKFAKKSCLILELLDYGVLRINTFQKLIDMGADPYSEKSGGSNILTVSAAKTFDRFYKQANEECEKLSIYIAENFDLSRLDHPNEYGITPLMYAIMKNKPNLVDALLKLGCDVNGAGGQPVNGYYYWMNLDGLAPIALTFREGNVAMAKKLLDAGADETICDSQGTPALFALVFAPSNRRDYNVPQQRDLSNRKGEIVKMLKQPDFADSNGETLLMKALTRYDYTNDKKISPFDNEGVMAALLERGVNVNAANNKGMRPLHYAAQYWSGIVKELLAAGAEIDAQDNEGNTALIYACDSGNEKLARLLVRKGADFNIKNNDGKSAVDIAVEKGLSDVLEQIMQ